jgi:hypothetical protein
MPLTGDTVPANTKYALGEIRLSIRPVPADSLYYTSIQSASSWQESLAAEYASRIVHHYNMQDTLITLNPYFMFPQNDGMRYQKLDVIIGIPVNTEVIIDESLSWRTNYSDFSEDGHDGGPYIMTATGLKSKYKPQPENDTISKGQ